MKSNPYFWLIAILSLLLGLSLGQIKYQHDRIEDLTRQQIRQEMLLRRANSHSDCSRMMQRQHLRYHIDHYREALKELSQSHPIVEPESRLDKVRVYRSRIRR